METELTAQSRTLINPVGTEGFYNTWQFSQAVRVQDMIWVAGQIGVGQDGCLGKSIEEQARLAFTNLTVVLKAAGSSLEDVVELVTYHLAMEDLQRFAAIKAEFFTQDYPSWTVVGVSALALPGLLVEVKATAVVGSRLRQAASA
jgi:enamine deaminase RidA (YjgF/YER057c/UK114 family)